MQGGRLLSYDPVLGIATYFHYEKSGSTEYITIEYRPMPWADKAIVERNKKLQNMGKEMYRSKTKGETDMWKVGEIPASVLVKWLVEEGIDVRRPEHWDAVKRKLNDPEYRHLRSGLFAV